MSFSLPSFLKSQICPSLPTPSSFPSQSARTHIIIGATSGLGLACAKQLHNLNTSRLILTARSSQRGETAKQQILSTSTTIQPGKVEVWELDLDSYSSIQNFCSRVEKEGNRIDGVLMNAGVLMEKYATSPEGWEEDLQVNVLSTALLAELLIPILSKLSDKESEKRPTRITFVNSLLHMIVDLKKHSAEGKTILDQVNTEKDFGSVATYSRSKLLQGFYINELCNRINAASAASDTQPTVVINAVNPGYCASNLTGGADEKDNIIMKTVKGVVLRSTEDGATCLTHALVAAGDDSHGGFLNDCAVTEWSKHITKNPALQRRVYDEVLTVLEKEVSGVKVLS